MEKIISIIVSAFLFVLSLFIPGEKPYECETVKIKGISYQNGFVTDNMHFVNDYHLPKEKPIYINLFAFSFGAKYYEIEDNWIYRGDNTGWGVDIKNELFCPVDEWDSLYSYYEDGNNYNYYFDILFENKESQKYDISNPDTEKLDEVIQFSVDNEYGSTSKNKAETITLPNILTPIVYLYKDSKDGLFTTHTLRYIVYEGRLYYYRCSNMADGTIEVSVLPDELEEHFISLLKSTELNSYFS